MLRSELPFAIEGLPRRTLAAASDKRRFPASPWRWLDEQWFHVSSPGASELEQIETAAKLRVVRDEPRDARARP